VSQLMRVEPFDAREPSHLAGEHRRVTERQQKPHMPSNLPEEVPEIKGHSPHAARLRLLDREHVSQNVAGLGPLHLSPAEPRPETQPHCEAPRVRYSC